MSGGEFDYKQYEIREIGEAIQGHIDYHLSTDKYVKDDYCEEFSDETINQFKIGALLCKVTSIYVNRIDWLISADDGEEQFHKRLKEDLGQTLEKLEKLIKKD